MRRLLIPFSALYWLIIVIRNWFFDIELLKTTSIGIPVISVGNISTGGVGKTPFVEWLVEVLGADHQVAVVSRGYGRKTSGLNVVSDGKRLLASAEASGDEPFQIAQKYPGVIVVVDEQRVRGAIKAKEIGARVIILDDGFQHRYLHRDRNIVIVTAQELLRGDLLLPAGNRREPLSALLRADFILISRCQDEEEFRIVSQRLTRFNKPIAGMQTRIKDVRNVYTSETLDHAQLGGKSALLFSGIGTPESFEQLLKLIDLKIIHHAHFPDHYWYSDNDLNELKAKAARLKVDFIVTTEKDSARISQKTGLESSKTIPMLKVGIRQEIIFGEENLRQFFTKILHSCELESLTH
jgi:tetraacyldisaccharide 4'-kinase